MHCTRMPRIATGPARERNHGHRHHRTRGSIRLRCRIMCASRTTPRKLLFGPYRTPRFRYGSVVFCEVRGEGIITGLTDAPIPWPLGKVGKRGRARALSVYRRFADADRLESASAGAHCWGVTPQTV